MKIWLDHDGTMLKYVSMEYADTILLEISESIHKSRALWFGLTFELN